MNKLTLSAAGLLVASLPLAAQADGFEIGGETGISLSVPSGGGATETVFEAALEAAHASGIFVGIGLESLNGAAPDSVTYNFSFGYGMDLGGDTALTVAYARHYLDVSGYDTQDITTTLEFPLGEGIDGSAEVVYDLPSGNVDVSAGAEFGIGNGLTAALTVGHDGAAAYGDAGVSYDINDNVSASATVEFAAGSAPVFVFGFAVALGG